MTRDEGNAAQASVVIVRHDPLAEPRSVEWPHLAAPLLSLWEPIPVGVDEDGQLVTVRLPERNVLIGGEPGAGKSVALSMLVATAALDPTVKLWVLDGKRVELAAWSGVAKRSAGPDGEDTLDLRRGLRVEMEDRYAALLARGLRKVSAGDGLPLHMVVCDELAFYLSLSDRKQRAEFAELMRDLVSRGRAAGIIVVAATQKPSADTVPTTLRDLFGFRWALRCNTPQASDTILGQGWASLGYSAAQIAGGQRGVGYFLAEGGEPVRLRSCFLDDLAIEGIAARAARLRSETARTRTAA